MQQRWIVIIPAAGSGTRFGGDLPKQFLDLAGTSIIGRSAEAALAVEHVHSVIVAVHPSMEARTRSALSHIGHRVAMVHGGTERQHSIAQALDHPSAQDADLVFVHDAVRPMASASLYRRVAAAASQHGAAIPALPVKDTIKRVDRSGRIIETLPRSELRTIQTPQAFRPDVLLAAYAYARHHGIIGTDDASLVEAAGHPVVVVDGEETNLKITTPLDLVIAQHLLTGHDRA